MKRIAHLIAAAALLLPGAAFAKGKTLIELTNGKPTSALAKSWKKTGEGKYDFTLDTSAEIAAGKKITPAAVKSSLEEKLGSSGVKVSAKGSSGVSVTYTGPEKEFLDKVSKTRIKPSADVEVALEGSGSEGGIRAKTTDRAPTADEVKAVVVSINAPHAELRVTSSSKSGIADGSKIKVNLPAGVTAKKGEILFVKPTALNGDTWDVSAASKN